MFKKYLHSNHLNRYIRYMRLYLQVLPRCIPIPSFSVACQLMSRDAKRKLKTVPDHAIFVFPVHSNCTFRLHSGADECTKTWLWSSFFTIFEFYEKYLRKKYVSLSHHVSLTGIQKKGKGEFQKGNY